MKLVRFGVSLNGWALKEECLLYINVMQEAGRNGQIFIVSSTKVERSRVQVTIGY